MTKAEARAAVRWFQKRMGIADWKIILEFQDSPPEWIENKGLTAAVNRLATAKKAWLWISATRAQEDGDTLLVCLFHECLHVAEDDVNLPHPTSDAAEYLWEQLAAVCETAYLAETKGKRRKKR